MKHLRWMIPLACMALPAASTVSADTFRAVVVDPAGFCGLFDGDGGLFVTEDTRVVGSHSANGNSKLTCKANDVPNSTGAAVTWDFATTGAYCVIPSPHGALITDQWHITVSASGVATLQCHYKNPAP